MKTTCLLLLCALTQLSAECPPGCKCSRFYYVLRCRNASLTDIPRIDPGLTIYNLDLSRNHLTKLRNGSFQERNIVDLYKLSLGHNNISTIEADAFRGLSESLISLNLQNNPHIRLPEDGFQLSTLTFLYLTSCNLTSIPNSFFKGIPDLDVLSLRDNSLTYFDPSIVNPRTGLDLERLSLSANKFTRLPLELVSILDISIEFDGNPFHCDCEFHFAYSVWARLRNGRVTCASPPHLHGVSGLRLLDMKLYCDVSTSELVPYVTWWDLLQWLVLSGALLVGVIPLVAYLLYKRGNCLVRSRGVGEFWDGNFFRDLKNRTAFLKSSAEGSSALTEE